MSDMFIYCYRCDYLVEVVTSGELDTVGDTRVGEDCLTCGGELERTDEEGYGSIMAWGDTSREYWEVSQ